MASSSLYKENVPRPMTTFYRAGFVRTARSRPSNNISDESKSNVQHQASGDTLTKHSGQPQMSTRTDFVRTVQYSKPNDSITNESKLNVKHQASGDTLTSRSDHTRMSTVKEAWSQNETEKKEVTDNAFEIMCSSTKLQTFFNMFEQLLPIYQNAKPEFKLLVCTDGQKVGSENILLYQKEIEKLTNENNELRKTINEQSNFANKEYEMSEINKQNTQMTMMQHKLSNYENIQADNKKLREDLEIEKTNYERQKIQCGEFNSQLIETNKKMEKMNDLHMRRVGELEKELSETKTRLSKAIGDTLKTNNPNIADLSDQYRPTKLADMYRELYDNEWTDAFEVADNCFPEQSVQYKAKLLLDLLMEIKEFCEEEFRLQENELIQALYRTKKSNKEALPDVIKQQLNELKKCAVLDMVVPLYQKLLQSDKRTFTKYKEFTSKVSDYVMKCMKLCWLMTISDPPVVLEHGINVTMARTKYKAFTQSGDNIEYIVWPVLLLHEGGSVLAPGIAQYYHSTRQVPQISATYNNFQDQPLTKIRKTTARNNMLSPSNPDSFNPVKPSKESTQQSVVLTLDRVTSTPPAVGDVHLKTRQRLLNADHSYSGQTQDNMTFDKNVKQMNNSTPYSKQVQVNYNDNAMNKLVTDYSKCDFPGESHYQSGKHINEHYKPNLPYNVKYYYRPDSGQRYHQVPFDPKADIYKLPAQNTHNSNYQQITFQKPIRRL